MNCKYCGGVVEQSGEHAYAYCEECDIALDPDEMSIADVTVHKHKLEVICYTSEKTIEDAVVNGNGVVDIYLDSKCFSSGLTFVDKENPLDCVSTMVGTLRAIGHEVVIEWVVDNKQIYDYTYSDTERDDE